VSSIGVNQKRVLVLGATGLLGSSIFRLLIQKKNINVVGSIRSLDAKDFFHKSFHENLAVCRNVNSDIDLDDFFRRIQPDIVINCISLDDETIKRQSSVDFIYTYALLPHRLANLCARSNSRLIQISTDGVFNGLKGSYSEDDIPDSKDLYGISKYLGEPKNKNTIILRTSIIGHGVKKSNNLMDWFLSQRDSCQGYTRVIFSGLPTIMLAAIIHDYIIPNKALHGVYHLASKPISKFDLLTEIAKVYHKKIAILPNDLPISDRTLNPIRFFLATGYKPQEWTELIKIMYEEKMKRENYVQK
jgi:dTDP-4-dehydrorhamnose reductase